MPGIDLNLDLPTLADSLSDIVTKLTTALSAIEDDLAAQVTSGAITIDAELSFNGQPLTNVGGVRISGGESSVVGTLYMDGADLWVMTSDGAVKLTADGGVNVAGAGGIGGDYGSGDELVSYDLASQEYRMFADPSAEYADVVLDDLVLMESFGGGSVRLDVDPSITTARTFSIKTLNAAGVSMLVYDASTSTLETSDTKRATNVVNVTTLNASSTIVSSSTVQATTFKHTNEHVKRLHNSQGIAASGNFSVTTADMKATTVSSGGFWVLMGNLMSGDRPKIVQLRLNKTSGGNISVELFKHTRTAGTTSLGTFTYSTLGVGDLVCTIGSPSALADGEDLLIQIQTPAVGDEIRSTVLYWDRP